MEHHIFNTKQGFSLLEVLIAMLFLAGALVGFSAFMPYGRGVVGNAGSDRLAVEFAAGKLEQMTAAGFGSPDLNSSIWSSVTINNRGTPPAADDLIGQYKMDVSANQIYSGKLKQAAVTLWYPINRNGDGTINGSLQASQKEVRLAKFIGQ